MAYTLAGRKGGTIRFVPFQNGVIGLINAIEKYDVTSPDLFPSYFPLWVRQYMQRLGTIRGTILRYPAHYRDQLNIIVSDASSIIEDDNFEEAVSLVTDKAKAQSGLSDEEIIKYILELLIRIYKISDYLNLYFLNFIKNDKIIRTCSHRNWHASFRQILPMTASKFLEIHEYSCGIFPCPRQNLLENLRTIPMRTSS